MVLSLSWRDSLATFSEIMITRDFCECHHNRNSMGSPDPMLRRQAWIQKSVPLFIEQILSQKV